MRRIIFCVFLMFMTLMSSAMGVRKNIKYVRMYDGIYKVANGSDSFSPYDIVAGPFDAVRNSALPEGKIPFRLEEICLKKSDRGISVAIPLGSDEQLYGFGLQIGSFGQRGLKKQLKVNDNPLNNLGYSHAPVPFYVSTAGYGIVVNTSRYVTFLCGSNPVKQKLQKTTDSHKELKHSVSELYDRESSGDYVFVDVPGAEELEVFILTGPDIRTVLQRYNLLSGGGCLPPLWGLGLKYRTKLDFNDEQVEELADYFREAGIPCDVIGLEPGWQTQVYPCSYLWNGERFRDPVSFISSMSDKGFRVNLWEHAYIHPESPAYDDMYDLSGDFVGMNGLVPDFMDSEARDVFSDVHDYLLDMGVSGFKLDECDNSNIAKGDMNWCFPDMASFPSGIDGEKMHQMFGQLYAEVIYDLYRKAGRRTYLDYRSSGLFASSLPAVLYSDTYDRRQYAEMVANSGFSGLLWSPELRESHSVTEMLRRLQLCLLSAQAVVNGWYLDMPPWLQYDVDRNVAGIRHERSPFMELAVRKLVNSRMSLVPYLYSAFYQYYLNGVPPFRALVSDYTDDSAVYDISDQFLVGDALMAAPVSDDSSVRDIYFPEGVWYDFNTGKRYEGNRTYTVELPLDCLPLFVRSGTVLPLAEPVQHISDDVKFRMTYRIYGDGSSVCRLYEDDGVSFDYLDGEYRELEVRYSEDRGILCSYGDSRRYETIGYEIIH